MEENNNLDAFCDNICSNVIGSRLIINDLSAPLKVWCKEHSIEDYNPSLNVFWEYGYAAGLSKRQLVICEDNQLKKLPFDVGSKHILKYSKNNLKAVLEPLIRAELKKPLANLKPKSNDNKESLNSLLTKRDSIFSEMNSGLNGDLDLCIKVIPTLLENKLFDNRALKRELRKHSFGPSLTVDVFNRIFFTLKPRRIGLYSITNQEFLNNTFMAGNLLISNEGIVLFKWWHNDARQYGTLRRLPTYYISCFILGLLDFLSIFFIHCNYNDTLKFRFTVDKLKNWRYTPIADFIPVDNFFTTSSKDFEPIEFECNAEELSSNKSKLEITKNILKEMLLDMEFDEEFDLNPEIIDQYKE